MAHPVLVSQHAREAGECKYVPKSHRWTGGRDSELPKVMGAIGLLEDEVERVLGRIGRLGVLPGDGIDGGLGIGFRSGGESLPMYRVSGRVNFAGILAKGELRSSLAALLNALNLPS